MISKSKYLILPFLLIAINSVFSQFQFKRDISSFNKENNSDTIRLVFTIKNFIPNEICRVQQKILPSFKIINDSIPNIYQKFDKDVYTLIWTNLPNEKEIKFYIDIKAPSQTSGYIYLNEAACWYGGAITKPSKTYLKPQKYLIVDTTKIFKPEIDTNIYAQIDSILNIKPVKKGRKGKKIIVEKKDKYYFRIQITATKHRQSIDNFRIDKFKTDLVFEEFIDALYKYSYGNYKNYLEAKQQLEKYKKEKNINGFIVAYKNNKRIGIKEAQEETEDLIEE